MGCDIHSHAERRVGDHWQEVRTEREPFGDRSYGVFGFLAGVRNYSAVPPIAEQRGTPADADEPVREQMDGLHSCSWLSVEELAAFDYDAPMEDRRCTRRMPAGYLSGGETCDLGEGTMTTFRDFLGSQFFDDLAMLQEAGAERVVFGFDS